VKKSRGPKNKREEVYKMRYAKPVLRVYGNLEALTRTTTHVGTRSDTRGAMTDARTH
jgi:hypothetical protein